MPFLDMIQPVASGCWEWGGFIHPGGYGRVRHDGKTCQAHRVAYELFVGPIPEDLHVDHLCSNRTCVNPDHLDAVAQAENNRRTAQRGRARGRAPWKTHCVRGHARTSDNLYNNGTCRACAIARATASTRRRRTLHCV